MFETQNRKHLYIALGGCAALVLILVITLCAVLIPGGDEEKSAIPIIDGNNNLASNLRAQLKNQLSNFDFKDLSKDPKWSTSTLNKTDLNLLKKGDVVAQFWSVNVDCTRQYKDAVAATLEQIDVIKRLAAKYPEKMSFATDSKGISKAIDAGKIASLIGIEGGHSIDSRMGVLRMYYDLGVRYMALNHECETPWLNLKDITEYGKKIIKEMNRLGMMIDLSGSSFSIALKVMSVSLAPVIFSSSVPTNESGSLPETLLARLIPSRSIVMLNLDPAKVGGQDANLTNIEGHLNHIVEVTKSFDHIGIGSNFGGFNGQIKMLEDSSKFPNLLQYLHKKDSKKWSKENLNKLASGNLIRVLKEVEKAKEAASGSPPNEDWIEDSELIASNKNITNCRLLE